MQPVGLAFAYKSTKRHLIPSKRERRFYLGSAARTTLQLLWSKGHISFCGTLPSQRGRTERLAFRMHFSKLALLTLLAIALAQPFGRPEPHEVGPLGPFDLDIPSYFDKAAQDAEARPRPYAPCPCRERLETLQPAGAA